MDKRDYFYARGKRIELSRSSKYIAVDLARADRGTKEGGESVNWTLPEDARRVRRRVFLIECKSLTKSDSRVLKDMGALLPVFANEGTMTIVLPEVRVETNSQDEREQFEEWLAKRAPEALMKSASDSRLVLELPDAEAALDLANQANEQLDPRLAQARMLRIVPRR